MKKTKKIAKRLRTRARELRQQEAALQRGDRTSTDRAGGPAEVARVGFIADVLDEVADQLAPRPKKMLEAWTKARKRAKKAAKAARATSPSTNGAPHGPDDLHASASVGG